MISIFQKMEWKKDPSRSAVKQFLQMIHNNALPIFILVKSDFTWLIIYLNWFKINISQIRFLSIQIKK